MFNIRNIEKNMDMYGVVGAKIGIETIAPSSQFTSVYAVHRQ